MTVTNDNGVLRVILSEAETVHYGIDAVLFDERSKEAKASLKKLLKIAAIQHKVSLDASRFSIEIYPIFDGGCEIFFVPRLNVGRKFKAVKKHRRQRTFAIELKDGEAVLEVCCRLFKAGITVENRLFKVKRGYRLVIEVDSKVLTAVGELSSKVVDSPLEIAKTLEYGVEICRNAVERIGLTLDGR